MDLIVKYIGNDLRYWKKIQQKFHSVYPDFNFHFLTENVSEAFQARKIFVKTFHEMPHIVYVDFSMNEKECLYFCKLFNRNNITRLSSLVALHEYTKGWNLVYKSILASVRIVHFKSVEIQDVVYDPISLLNVDLAKDPEFAEGKEIGNFNIKQILRVSYVEDDLFHIETNSPIPMYQIIETDNNPLEKFIPSKRFYVKNFSDHNLYYNSRFSYDLEFTYMDDTFFKATEESWLHYKDFRDNPLGYKQETGKRYDDLYDDVRKRKEKIRPLREGLRNWITQNEDKILPKKLKIMVLDNTMAIFSELDESSGNFPYSINIRNKLTKTLYQLKRSRPHLIVVHADDKNNLIEVKRLIDEILSIKNYEPYILLFNYHEDQDIRILTNYSKILTYKNNVHLDTIKALAAKMDAKLHLSDSKNRIYFETSSPESMMTFSRKVKVLKMTESILYFNSEIEIPMWTTFMMDHPAKMLITVVPHKQTGRYKSIKNCYRSMIHALGENEKAILRRNINKSLNPEE